MGFGCTLEELFGALSAVFSGFDASTSQNRDVGHPAKVRFVGPDVAIIYGKETAVVTGTGGKDFQRTLIWTDTALRRKGKWQLIAVQDMVEPKK